MQGHCINTQTDGVSWILIVLGIVFEGIFYLNLVGTWNDPGLEQLFQTSWCSLKKATHISRIYLICQKFSCFTVFMRGMQSWNTPHAMR